MKNQGTWKGSVLFVVGVIATLASGAAFGQVLVLDDPLQGSTLGTVWMGPGSTGGTFTTGGWNVGTDTTADFNDAIYWHIPTLPRGAAEFTVIGLRPDGAAWPTDKIELFSMYDYTFQDADNTYGGWRNNPFKHFMRQEGVSEGAKNNMMEIEWLIAPNATEPDSDALTWDPAVPYTFHLEWGPEGNASTLVITRNGTEIIRTTTDGNWTPAGHSVRIGSPAQGPRPSPFGATYSNVKVWDMTGIPLPAPPAPPAPPPGSVTGTSIPGMPTGFVGTNPLLSSFSSSSSPGSTTPAPPPVGPQYTGSGNNLSTYQTASGAGSGSGGSGSGGGGGGGGCWAGPRGGRPGLALFGLVALAVVACARRRLAPARRPAAR